MGRSRAASAHLTTVYQSKRQDSVDSLHGTAHAHVAHQQKNSGMTPESEVTYGTLDLTVLKRTVAAVNLLLGQR